MQSILIGAIALVVGVAIGYIVNSLLSSRKADTARQKAEKLLLDAKNKSQDIILESKNKAIDILEEAKKDEQERSKQLSIIENLLSKKESELEIKVKETEEHKK